MTSSPPDARPRTRRGRLAGFAIAVAVLLAGAYAATFALMPLPAPAIALEPGAEQSFEADPASAQEAVDAQPLPSAIGWLDGEEVWANDDEPHPIASISKVVTALVGLEHQPLEPDEAGPVHVWDEQDEAAAAGYLADDGVVFPIPVGTEVTARQMLTLMMLPSANDFAEAYARSVFGDDDTFVAAVDAWTSEHGLDTIHLSEPTGMSDENVASTADLVRLARLALADPTLAELVGTATAVLPWGIGEIRNTNPLLGSTDGVVGVKTGQSEAAGSNLLAAQRETADGRELVKIAVVLGRPDEEARADASRELLDAMSGMARSADSVTAGERIGTATGVDGAVIPLVAEAAESAVLVPGETVRRIPELAPPAGQERGSAAGAIRIDAPDGERSVAVVTAKAGGADPGFWWRLSHPLRMLGIA